MAYTDKEIEKIFNSICDDIIEGESLRNCLKSNKLSSQTFYIWVDSSEEKSKQYARCTELRAEYLFEEMFEIADNKKNDFTTDKDGNLRINQDAINRNRLQVDTRKWALSKMNPKKYGEKLGLEHSGEIATKVIKGITFDE